MLAIVFMATDIDHLLSVLLKLMDFLFKYYWQFLRPRHTFSCNRILNVFQFAGKRCSSCGAQHNNAQGLNSDRGRKMWALMLQWNLPVLYSVTSLSLSKTEGKSKNHHLSAHITSLLLSSQMKAQCVAPFNKGQ